MLCMACIDKGRGNICDEEGFSDVSIAISSATKSDQCKVTMRDPHGLLDLTPTPIIIQEPLPNSIEWAPSGWGKPRMMQSPGPGGQVAEALVPPIDDCDENLHDLICFFVKSNVWTVQPHQSLCSLAPLTVAEWCKRIACLSRVMRFITLR